MSRTAWLGVRGGRSGAAAAAAAAARGALSLESWCRCRLSLDGQNKWLSPPSVLSRLMFMKEKKAARGEEEKDDEALLWI